MRGSTASSNSCPRSPADRDKPAKRAKPTSTAPLLHHSLLTLNQSMAVERTPSGSSLIDVLDRVLDKGIVIDAWVRVSLVGIDLVTVEARIVVASIDTYLKYSEAVGITAPMSRPREVAPATTRWIGCSAKTPISAVSSKPRK